MCQNYSLKSKIWKRVTVKTALMLACLAFGLMLAACGKKPGMVDPPPDVENDTFPHVYPDPSTDPKPESP